MFSWFVTLWKSSFPRNQLIPQKLLPFNPPSPSEFPMVFIGGGGYGYFLEPHNVHKVLLKSTIHQKLNARFQNRPRLCPIPTQDVQVRHQIDLVNMNKLCTKYKGKVFRYVLSVMDVFSRYHWLVPLQRNRSSHVACELIRIYREHGAPLVIQHDQGREFDGAVSRLCKQLQIKVIKGRPYHPQSQGKVERAYRTFKKKLRYDFLSTKKAGVSWPEGLPHYAQALNQDPMPKEKRCLTG